MSRRTWHVVIADDNAEDRADIRRLLLQGSEDRLIFKEVTFGREAVAAAHDPDMPPDCMILDYFLPDMEAPAILASLREASGLTRCPVVVLTGAASGALGHAVLRAGAQDFIGKDWLSSGGLVRAMENASERWLMARELERGARVLSHREHELRTLIDNTPAVLTRFDAQFRYLYANAAITRATGLSPDKVIGRTQPELGMPVAAYLPWHGALAAVFASGSAEQLDLSVQDGDDTTHYVTHFVPEFDTERRVMSVLAVTHDITSLRQVEQALRREDQRKDEFLAVLAHELRNPLAALSTGLQILKAATIDTAATGPVQGMMERQFRHMVRLVDDLLDVSRISHGKIELRRECISIQTVLEHAVEANQALLTSAGHVLTCNVDARAILVDGDLTRLAQVVGNLLHNAIKYTPHGGHIGLSLHVEADEAVICVTDNGAGIPPDMVAHVFDLFAQVDHTLHRAQGGLGIGLNVVAELVGMHDGSVTGHSDGLGLGSTFTVRLPLASDAAKDVSPVALVPTTPVAVSHRLPRVLVIDDNVDAAETMAMILEMHDCITLTAHDGVAGIAASTAFLPDMILLDIGLPDINGYEVAARLRAHPTNRGVLLVALTGWGGASDRLRSTTAGFDAHLTKPTDANIILLMLHAHLAGADGNLQGAALTVPR